MIIKLLLPLTKPLHSLSFASNHLINPIMHGPKSLLSIRMKINSMPALISQKVSEALRIWKEHFRSRNGRSSSRQAAPSCTVTANNRIVISRAQKHRTRECWNWVYSDAPWLAGRHGAFGFEIKRRGDGVVVAGMVKSIGTARFTK